MRINAPLASLLVPLAIASAHACSPVKSIDLRFSENSAVVPGLEVMRLAHWIADQNRTYPNQQGTFVGGLAETTERNARELAMQRANRAKTLLLDLGLGKAPIEVKAHVYTPEQTKDLMNDVHRVEIDFLPGCPHECPCQVAHESKIGGPSELPLPQTGE